VNIMGTAHVKTDTGAQDSAIDEEHDHPPAGEVWLPAVSNTAFSPITNAVADTFGAAWVQVIAATPAGQWIDFHRALLVNPLISAMLADAVYHVEIGVGAPAAEVRWTEFRFYVDTVAGNNLPRQPLEIMCPRIPPGSRVAVRVKRSLAGAVAVDLQLGYHAYTAGL
jgi:hypothetical protein